MPLTRPCSLCGGHALMLAYSGDQWANPDGTRIQLLLCGNCDKIKCERCKQALEHTATVCKCGMPLRTYPDLTIPEAM